MTAPTRPWSEGAADAADDRAAVLIERRGFEDGEGHYRINGAGEWVYVDDEDDEAVIEAAKERKA